MTSSVPRWMLCLLPLLAGCIERPILESLPDIDFTAVSTGRDHACALAETAEIYCWSRIQPRPSAVPGDVPFASLATYWDHTCGIAVDGAAYCWGLNTAGQLGALSEDSVPCGVPGAGGAPCGRTPALVAGDHVFSQLSVGAAHTCGIDTGGETWCWGANGAGQLGTDEETACDPALLPEGFLCSTTPVRVAGGHRFVQISAGRAHTCAVDDLGDAYCWGFGGEGRLGTGATDSRAAPALVAGGLRFTSVQAGGSHTCGVTPDGRGFCWGSNVDGQLGSLAEETGCGLRQFRCVSVPQPVGGDLAFAAISPSDAVRLGRDGVFVGGHSCGLVPDGTVHCWGLNTSGQLVNHASQRSSAPVRLQTEHRFAQISAGRENTCGVTVGARVFCWAFGGPVRAWYVFPRD